MIAKIGKILKINESADWNKAVQDGVLVNLFLKIMVFASDYVC